MNRIETLLLLYKTIKLAAVMCIFCKGLLNKKRVEYYLSENRRCA